jgi:hypothetical protein
VEQEFELTDEAKSYLPIDQDLRLAITGRNWQLQKRNIAGNDSKTPGKETWASFRYYTSLKSALTDIVHIKVAQETFRSAQGLIEANTRVIDGICKALSPKLEVLQPTIQDHANESP